jgi:hypothetical protein
MLIEYFGCRSAINRENEYFLEVNSRNDVNLNYGIYTVSTYKIYKIRFGQPVNVIINCEITTNSK